MHLFVVSTTSEPRVGFDQPVTVPVVPDGVEWEQAGTVKDGKQIIVCPSMTVSDAEKFADGLASGERYLGVACAEKDAKDLSKRLREPFPDFGAYASKRDELVAAVRGAAIETEKQRIGRELKVFADAMTDHVNVRVADYKAPFRQIAKAEEDRVVTAESIRTVVRMILILGVNVGIALASRHFPEWIVFAAFTTVSSDAFNQADFTNVAGMTMGAEAGGSANTWQLASDETGPFRVLSLQMDGAGNTGIAYDSTQSAVAIQRVTSKATNISNPGMMCRYDATNHNGYLGWVDGTIYKHTGASSYSALTSSGTSIATNDIIGMQSDSGSGITELLNGSTNKTATDSSYATGVGALRMYAGGKVDDWLNEADSGGGGFSTAMFRENAGLGGVGGGPFARANAGLGAIA